jgi:hypothetical protein
VKATPVNLKDSFVAIGDQGRSMVTWIAQRGAKHRLILLRRGMWTKDADDFTEDLETCESNIKIASSDMSGLSTAGNLARSPNRIDAEKPIHMLGAPSNVVVDSRNRFIELLKVDVPVIEILRGTS